LVSPSDLVSCGWLSSREILPRSASSVKPASV
jgi:hypothetical protein